MATDTVTTAFSSLKVYNQVACCLLLLCIVCDATGDIGREKIDNIFASILGAESAHVRTQYFSGTHAISCALFGSVKPGDCILSVTGHPYDTLEEVIGTRPGSQTQSTVGSLKHWGVDFREIPLLDSNSNSKSYATNSSPIDIEAMDSELERHPNIKLIHVQRLHFSVFS